MTNAKIGAIIPIRLASERLPQKAIKHICGKPIVHHLLDRAFDSKYLEKENVIVCTTEESSDDALVEVVESYGANVFRGSTNDLLDRFDRAIDHYGFDYVIQIDGDDICAEPEYMDLTMDKLLSDENLDTVSAKGLPLGISTKSFSKRAMKKVIAKYRSTENDTGFGSYFTEPAICNHIAIEPVSEGHILERIRLTLDYQEDFDFFNAIYTELYKEGEVFHLEDILKLVKEKPEIIEINYFLQEEYFDRWHSKQNFFFSDGGDELKKVNG